MDIFEFSKKLSESYDKGQNIIDLVNDFTGSKKNTSLAIELSYDLQAGSYTKNFLENYNFYLEHNDEIYNFLRPYLSTDLSILDVGTGELTNLTLF